MECMTTQLSKLEPRKITWLWQDRLPLAKLVMLAGDPGIGKSYLTTWLAARVTRADAFPDCPAVLRKPADVVFLSAEDDPADTILPRCIAAGVDLSRVSIIDGVSHGETEGEEGFSLDRHLDALAATLKRLDRPRLVVIDPVSAYMGDTDSNSNSQVRAVLRGLSELAHKYGPTILCVTHLNKSQLGGTKAVYRTMGSLAFVAAARLAYYVSTVNNHEGKDTGTRCIAMVKNNIGAIKPAMTYEITDNGFRWCDMQSELTADDLDKGLTARTTPNAFEDAVNFLQSLLANGPISAQAVQDEADKKRIGIGAVRKAKDMLGIQSIKQGKSWLWTLPTSQPSPGLTQPEEV